MHGNCKNLRLVGKDNNQCRLREARGKFIHYRILPWYFTAVRLHETGLLENNLCWNSKGQVGNFIHVMWACPLVLPLW